MGVSAEKDGQFALEKFHLGGEGVLSDVAQTL